MTDPLKPEGKVNFGLINGAKKGMLPMDGNLLLKNVDMKVPIIAQVMPRK
jgi:hypothetical protein